MVVTDERFWDCECDDNYIHPVSVKSCPICKALEDDQPNSRPNEMIADAVYANYKESDVLYREEINSDSLIITINLPIGPGDFQK